jgi:RNase H-fold protein (predicted Holliday junction resolvase)
MNEKTVLAIDPGTKKCGMAIVQRLSEEKVRLLWRSVAPTDKIVPKLHEAYAAAPYNLIIVGGGTHSKEVVSQIRAHLPSMGILVVDEKDTSFQARERYWEHNPRRGWRRILPSTLQVPPDPVDDFVAMILAERVLLGG